MSVLMILYRPGYASWIVAPNHRKSLRNILKTHKTEHEKLFAAAIKHASRVWIVQFIESAMLEKGITFDFFSFFCDHCTFPFQGRGESDRTFPYMRPFEPMSPTSRIPGDTPSSGVRSPT